MHIKYHKVGSVCLQQSSSFTVFGSGSGSGSLFVDICSDFCFIKATYSISSQSVLRVYSSVW